MKKRYFYLKIGLLAAGIFPSVVYGAMGQQATGGKIYQFNISKRGSMLADATCYAWIPDHVNTLRSVIVHLHGCTREGDASQMMDDIQWKALAKKWHSVLLAPKFISGGNAKACVNWYNPQNGSDAVFIAMLDTLASRSGHPEVKSIPWALWGHSGGSFWITAMTGKYPERVAVAVAESCGFDISGVGAALQVPILYHNGILDLCYNGSSMFANGRRKGAFWAHAINPVAASPMDGHQVHDLRFLAIPWIDACLAMRLPAKEGGSKLRDITTQDAWLGDTTTRAIAPAVTFKGNKWAACWFPNRLLAEKWKEYMATGTITDSTPPPAPYNLTAAYTDHQIVLKWDCEPDLQSGIKTFIIYRNGSRWRTLRYGTKTKYSTQTGYQRWNDGDQPAPVPPPEMIFTDSLVNDRSKYTYQVSCVNWSDVEGKQSEKISLRKGKIRKNESEE